MGKKPPSTSRKQIKPSAPYARSSEPAARSGPVPVPVPLPVLSALRAPVPVAVPVAVPVPVAVAAPAPVAVPVAAPVSVPVPAPVAVAAPAPAPAPAPPPVLLERPRPPLLPTIDLRALARVSLGFCEAALTALPAPSDIMAGDPSAPAPPPGPVPPGDSRSLRLDQQFALVYRHGASLVSRRGVIGERGVWRVVDYPGPAQAAAAYAAECSRLRGQGFVDLI